MPSSITGAYRRRGYATGKHPLRLGGFCFSSVGSCVPWACGPPAGGGGGGGALQPLCTMNVTGGPPLAADHLHKGPTISSLWGTDLHEHQAQGSAQGR